MTTAEGTASFTGTSVASEVAPANDNARSLAPDFATASRDAPVTNAGEGAAVATTSAAGAPDPSRFAAIKADCQLCGRSLSFDLSL